MSRLISLFVVACLSAFAPVRAATAARPPDIVIFLADDLSVEDCAPYGNRDIPAPNMDALSREAMTFDRAYVASPSCSPSRAALLTGRYGLRTGALYNHQPVTPDTRKWPAYFHALGYEVVAIGKVSHYAQVTAYGFDYAGYYTYHEDVCVEKAVEWLNARRSEKPLCLLVGTNWPHVPWPQAGLLPPDRVNLPPELANTPETRAARARYATAVSNADRDLGMVRAAVKAHLPPETVFVFSADHGSQFPFAKWNLYEAGLRVPLMVAWRGHIAPGTRTPAMVSWLDFLPTLLEIAGADPKQAAPDIDGRSFQPVLAGRTNEHRDRVFGTHSGDGSINFYPARSVRIGRWKYIRNLDPSLEYHTHIDLRPADTGYWPSWIRDARTNPAIAAIVERYLQRPGEELYDLETDPHELHNLAAEPAHAADLARLRAAVTEWMHTLGDTGMPTELAHKPQPPPDQPAKKKKGK